MKQLLVYLKPYKKECIVGPTFKLLEAILELLLPTVMALIINNGVAKNDTTYILKYGTIMILMGILGFGASCVCQFYAARASQGYGTDLRNALFAHISSFSYKELDIYGAPTLLTRLLNDVNQLQLAVAMLIRLVIRAPFICIGAIVMAMFLNFKLSLILMGITPIFIIILYYIIRKTSPLYKLCQQKLDRLSGIVRENLSGIRVIRAFVTTKAETKRFHEATDELTTATTRVAVYSALLPPLTSLILNIGIILILWIGGIQINDGQFNAGGMIAYINYMTQVLLALIVVSNLVIIFTKAYTSCGRVQEVLGTASSIPNDGIDDSTEDTTEDGTSPFISFNDVNFAYYTTADAALSNISFTVEKGEHIGIIGPTGAGKSTLVNLLGRFYDTTSGSIFINGKNIKAYPLSVLRSLTAYVPQKSNLMRGTVLDNLTLGNKEATMEAVALAIKTAQATDFIHSLKEGYYTPVATGGQNFSGGQKQRLAIARALLKDSPILIFDDSSSALDFATEAKLRKALLENYKERTVFTISQRISSILHCDKIILMEDGEIVAMDTHENLLATCSLYQEIASSQMPDTTTITSGGSYA